jgi:hypothetical protein
MFQECVFLGTDVFTRKINAALTTTPCNTCKRSGSLLSVIKEVWNETQTVETDQESLLPIIRYINQIAATAHVSIIITPTLLTSKLNYRHTQKGGIIPYNKYGLECDVTSLTNSTLTPITFAYTDLRKLLMELDCEWWCVYVGPDNTLKWEATDLFTGVTDALRGACDVCHCPALETALEAAMRATLNERPAN